MSFKIGKPQKKKINWKLPVAILLGIVLVVAVLELTNTTHLLHKRKAVSGNIPSTSQSKENEKEKQSSSENDDSSNGSGATDSTSEKTTGAPSSGSDLLAPYGNFVSNHVPSLKNSSSMESVCITTPGASCTIIFTKDGVTKTLESKKANSNGAIIWSWDIDDAGFVEGSWKITATATLDGQTKSTSDIQNLEVQP